MKKLVKGDKAPDFTLKDQNGKEVSLSQFKGKKVLVYFYPKANTPGCTKQACSVRDHLPDLGEKGIESIGISPDSPKQQKNFKDKYNLNFTLLADEKREAAEVYGVWGKKAMYGNHPFRLSYRRTGKYHGIVVQGKTLRNCFQCPGNGILTSPSGIAGERLFRVSPFFS